jgi:hypothetical protein
MTTRRELAYGHRRVDTSLYALDGWTTMDCLNCDSNIYLYSVRFSFVALALRFREVIVDALKGSVRGMRTKEKPTVRSDNAM